MEYVLRLLAVCLCISTFGFATEKFATVVNPDCGQLCDNGTLLAYSRLQRHNDSLHVLLTVGEGLGDLSLYYVQSSEPRQRLNVSWPMLFSDDPEERLHALQFAYNDSTLAKFGIVFTELIEYADTSDQVDPSKAPAQNGSYFNKWPLSDFEWRASWQQLSGESYSLTLTASSLLSANSSEVFNSNGSVSVTLLLSAGAGRAENLPKLQFNGNSSQLEVQLNSLASNFKSSRYAVEAVLLADFATRQLLQSTQSIDDEYTPGIFHVKNWYAVNGDSPPLCFAQWKPVSYTSDERTLADSTVVHNSQLSALTDALVMRLNESLAYSLFGDVGDVVGATALNASFGQPKDKFYRSSNYTVWTVSVGIGQPPVDRVSLLLVIIIFCGLGLPLLLMLAGGVYVCVRRVRRATGGTEVSSYQPINA